MKELLEVTLQQTLQSLAVAGFVTSHFVDGVDDRKLPKLLISRGTGVWSRQGLSFFYEVYLLKCTIQVQSEGIKMSKEKGVYQLENGYWA